MTWTVEGADRAARDVRLPQGSGTAGDAYGAVERGEVAAGGSVLGAIDMSYQAQGGRSNLGRSRSVAQDVLSRAIQAGANMEGWARLSTSQKQQRIAGALGVRDDRLTYVEQNRRIEAALAAKLAAEDAAMQPGARRSETFQRPKVARDVAAPGITSLPIVGPVVEYTVKGGLKRELMQFYESAGGVVAAEFEHKRQHAEVIPSLWPRGTKPQDALAESRAAQGRVREEWAAQRDYGAQPEPLSIGHISQGFAIAGAWAAGTAVGLFTGIDHEAAPPASSLLVTPVPGGHFAGAGQALDASRAQARGPLTAEEAHRLGVAYQLTSGAPSTLAAMSQAPSATSPRPTTSAPAAYTSADGSSASPSPSAATVAPSVNLPLIMPSAPAPAVLKPSSLVVPVAAPAAAGGLLAGGRALVAKAKSKASGSRSAPAAPAPAIIGVPPVAGVPAAPPALPVSGAPMLPSLPSAGTIDLDRLPLGSSENSFLASLQARAQEGVDFIADHPIESAAVLGGTAVVAGGAAIVAHQLSDRMSSTSAPRRASSSSRSSAPRRSSKGANKRGIIPGPGLGPKEIDHGTPSGRRGKKRVTINGKTFYARR